MELNRVSADVLADWARAIKVPAATEDGQEAALQPLLTELIDLGEPQAAHGLINQTRIQSPSLTNRLSFFLITGLAKRDDYEAAWQADQVLYQDQLPRFQTRLAVYRQNGSELQRFRAQGIADELFDAGDQGAARAELEAAAEIVVQKQAEAAAKKASRSRRKRKAPAPENEPNP